MGSEVTCALTQSWLLSHVRFTWESQFSWTLLYSGWHFGKAASGFLQPKLAGWCFLVSRGLGRFCFHTGLLSAQYLRELKRRNG